MANYNLTDNDLRDALNEQLQFIQSSLYNFPNYEVEAKRIATTVRVLVHDTNHSTSLLKSLNMKETLGFVNSASPNDGRLHSMTGMVGVRGSNSDQYFGLIAKIVDNGTLTSVPLFRQHLEEWYTSYQSLDFDSWWEMEVMKIATGGLSRKQLVLLAANKDGGAHIDARLPESYYEAKTGKLKLNILGTETELDKNVIYASLAQIGWELKRSIEKKEN